MKEIITALLKRISGDYGNDLESYITARNPQNEGDVERFAREYNQHLVQKRY
jgi:hypothetical protein